jgi:hypothetical protein
MFRAATNEEPPRALTFEGALDRHPPPAAAGSRNRRWSDVVDIEAAVVAGRA